MTARDLPLLTVPLFALLLFAGCGDPPEPHPADGSVPAAPPVVESAPPTDPEATPGRPHGWVPPGSRSPGGAPASFDPDAPPEWVVVLDDERHLHLRGVEDLAVSGDTDGIAVAAWAVDDLLAAMEAVERRCGRIDIEFPAAGWSDPALGPGCADGEGVPGASPGAPPLRFLRLPGLTAAALGAVPAGSGARRLAGAPEDGDASADLLLVVLVEAPLEQEPSAD